MNAADQDAGEYGAPPNALFADDRVPETLKSLLRFIADDYLPEIAAFVGFTNAWLEERPDLKAGTSGLPRSQDRVIGQAAFNWRGVPITVGVMPYRVFLLQKLQDVADEATPAERVAIDALLSETGLSPLITMRAHRRIERHGQLEVWGPPA